MTASLISANTRAIFLPETFIEDTSLSDQTISYRTLPEFDALMRYEGRAYPTSSVGNARRVWNEAHIENDHISALALNVVPIVTPSLAELELARQRSEIDRLIEANQTQMARIATLSEPVTRGDDERLVEFWRIAALAANEAGFCPEYDKLATALGGVAREDLAQDYYVTMDLTTSVTYRVTVPLGANVEDNVWDFISVSDLEAEIDTSRHDWTVSSVDETDD